MKLSVATVAGRIDANDLARELLPYARTVAGYGLASDASDETAIGLALAHVNFERKIPGWCQCSGSEFGVYFRDIASGSHGWLCASCQRICQTG